MFYFVINTDVLEALQCNVRRQVDTAQIGGLKVQVH